MPRKGRPPQPQPGGLCKCNCGKFALNDGMFCADHELLWVAHAKRNSHNLQFKHRKLWKQFIRNYRLSPDLYARIARTFNIRKEIVDVQSAALRSPGQNPPGDPERAYFQGEGGWIRKV